MIYIAEVKPHEDSSLNDFIKSMDDQLKECSVELLHTLPEGMGNDMVSVMTKLLDEPDVGVTHKFNIHVIENKTFALVLRVAVNKYTVSAIEIDVIDDEIITPTKMYIGLKTDRDTLDKSCASIRDAFNVNHLGLHSLTDKDHIEELVNEFGVGLTDNEMTRSFNGDGKLFYDALYSHADRLNPEYVVSTFLHPDKPFIFPMCFTLSEVKFYKALQELHKHHAGDDKLGQLLIDLNRAYREQQMRLERIKLFIEECKKSRIDGVQ